MTDTNEGAAALETSKEAPATEGTTKVAAAGGQGSPGEVRAAEGGEGQQQQLTPEQQAAERQKREEAQQHKGKAQLRIQELARQKNYYRDKLMLTTAELDEIKRNAPALRDRSQYASDAEYELEREARQGVTVATQMASRDVREAQAQQARLEKEIWETKIESERDKYPDFEAVAYNPAVPYSDAMIEAVRGHDHGVEIVYHLGKNPEIARRIANLSPLQAAMEIGALGLRFSGNHSAAPQKRQSSAPAPIKTLPGSGAGAAAKKLTAMSMAEYAKFRGL